MVERGGGGGASETNKIKHTGRQTGCVYWPLKSFSTSLAESVGPFMQHIHNAWETVTVQVLG